MRIRDMPASERIERRALRARRRERRYQARLHRLLERYELDRDRGYYVRDDG